MPTASRKLHQSRLAFDQFLEGRRLGEAQPHEQADRDHDDAGEERHAPAPAQEACFGQLCHHAEDRGGCRDSDRKSDLHKAAPEAAAVAGMLGHHGHRAAPFAAEPDALHEAQHDQQDRRPDADLLIGRQAADQEGAAAHDQERRGQHRLAPKPVAEMADDRAADRARDEADRIAAERRNRADHGIEGREEQFVEHQRGRGAVDQEVVPFDRSAEHARPHDVRDRRCRAGGGLRRDVGRHRHHASSE
jgi:hypothetical protein